MGVVFPEIDCLNSSSPKGAATFTEGVIQRPGDRERRGELLPCCLEDLQTAFELVTQRDVTEDVVSDQECDEEPDKLWSVDASTLFPGAPSARVVRGGGADLPHQPFIDEVRSEEYL